MNPLSILFSFGELPGLVLILVMLTGLCFLIFGGNWLCRGACSIALQLRVSGVVVGLTVVSLATSAPELFTSLAGVLKGKPDLAMGNIIGSNAANIGLILGAAALIFPLDVHHRLIRWEIPILILVTALFWIVAMLGNHIGRWDGVFFLAMTATYLVLLVRTAKDSAIGKEIEEEVPQPTGGMFTAIVLVFLGTALLWCGAELLVEAATVSASRLGVSDTLIGLTLVAGGTSLPELGATLAAAMKRQSGIIIGNVIGSNLFNLILVCGIAGVIVPFEINPGLLRLELPMVLGITLFFSWFVISQRKVTRWEGGLLLVLYAIFILVSSLSQTKAMAITVP